MSLLHTPPLLAVIESFCVSGGPRHSDADGERIGNTGCQRIFPIS
jgi:hypothetical protein